MASTSPPKCPVLPDGLALTAAFVGMDKDRFSLMFAEDVQVLCASGSDCKIHPGAGPVDESFHRSTAAGDVMGTAGGDLLSSEVSIIRRIIIL